MEPKIYRKEYLPFSRQQIDEDVLRIIYRLNRAGFKGYLVGGGVRDLLLGKHPKDFDLATDARPEELRRLFRNSRLIGRRFRIAHIFFARHKIVEVATFRAAASELPEGSDELEPSTLAEDNNYGTEASDALRRDLTINALFFDPASQSVIDYVGGMDDMMAARIRIVGDPRTRFIEDPVRMIRAVRHAARSGFDLEPSCREAIEELHQLLEKAPAARLYDELSKDLLSGSLSDLLPLLITTKLSNFIVPGLNQIDSVLFDQSSNLIQALLRLDRQIREGEEVTVADVLAVLLLACIDPNFNLERIAAVFSDLESVSSSFREHFGTIPIPRRERERVAGMILSTLRATVPQDDKPLNLKRIPPTRLAQAEHLLRLIAPDSVELQGVQEALNPKNSREPHNRRRPRMRRRNKQVASPASAA